MAYERMMIMKDLKGISGFVILLNGEGSETHGNWEYENSEDYEASVYARIKQMARPFALVINLEPTLDAWEVNSSWTYMREDDTV